MVAVPEGVKSSARRALLLKKNGYSGGTETGFLRARQLIRGSIDVKTLRVMRNWFARHIVTSYPGYKKWVTDGKPTSKDNKNKSKYRGAVAWELWGGSAAYKWINSASVQKLLNEEYSNKTNRLKPI